jgi:hypothetical protein
MSVCFLMPVHPPHFGFANGFIASFERFGYQDKADICLVFTNEDERAQFVQETGAPVSSLILPPDLRNFENRGIINIKKIWALSQLTDSPYEYIIVIDAETELCARLMLRRCATPILAIRCCWETLCLRQDVKEPRLLNTPANASFRTSPQACPQYESLPVVQPALHLQTRHAEGFSVLFRGAGSHDP